MYQIVQEKKPKTGVLKNASETKRLEKEHKRLQLELSKVIKLFQSILIIVLSRILQFVCLDYIHFNLMNILAFINSLKYF